MSDYPWHAALATRLQGMLEAGRLPHALLVTAQPGWGDVEFARSLALRLLELPADTDTGNLAHPDFKWIEPDGSVIKIDAIRELAEFAVGTRQSAPRKAIVIESAHQLNINAGNALLKTLEEPPSGTHLILTASSPGRILPTIRSRCQLAAILPDRQQAESWLTAKHPEVADLQQLLFEYAGAPLDVSHALANEIPLLSAVLVDLARTPDLSALSGSLLEIDPDSLLSRWYRYCVAEMGHQRCLAELPQPDHRLLAAFADELIQIRRQILFTNGANVRLLLERLAVRWQEVFREKRQKKPRPGAAAQRTRSSG